MKHKYLGLKFCELGYISFVSWGYSSSFDNDVVINVSKQ